MESYKVIWNGTEIGQLNNPMRDISYLEGDWISNQTNDSSEFEKILKSQDTRQVISDISKGTEIILLNDDMDELNTIGISLDNNKLFVRHMTTTINTKEVEQPQSLIGRYFRWHFVGRWLRHFK